MKLLTYIEILALLMAALGTATIVGATYFSQKRLKRALRKRQQEISRGAEQYRLLQNEVRQLEAEHLRLQEDLRDSNTERARTENEREHLQATVYQLEAERLRLREHLEEAGEQRCRAEDERQRLDAEVRRLEAALRQLQEDLRHARSEQCRAEPESHPLRDEVCGVPSDQDREALQAAESCTQETGEHLDTPTHHENLPDAEKEDRQLDPGKRGGRSRGRSPDRQAGVSETTPVRRKPEVICWKRERQWIPGVELPEDLLDKADLQVLQYGSPLTRDESSEAYWRLDHASGEVLVRWDEDGVGREATTSIGEEDHLLFKLSGQEQNQGSRVTFPSCGSYLVMAPLDWERDEVLSGQPFVAPEPVSLDGYQSHFFSLDKNDHAKIAFHTPGGEEIVIHSKISRFELVGRRMEHDAAEYMGPLFGEGAPHLRDLSTSAWRDVGRIVVGEEGKGKNRWRTDFVPSVGRREQELPLPPLDGTGGWYFLRIYDDKDDRIESLDFRCLAELKDIRVHRHAVLPGPLGHTPVQLEFAHDAKATVRLASEGMDGPDIEREADRTVVIIPSRPAWDLTDWYVESARGSRVSVEILLERIWWSLGEEDAPLTQIEISDTPLSVSYDSFRATSDAAIRLYFPGSGWIHRVLVGFEESTGRPYQPKLSERILSVPLRDFCEADDIRSRSQNASLKLWLERNGTLEGGIVILDVLSEVTATPGPAGTELDPNQMLCCTTCDHARTRNDLVWCRRRHWPAVAADAFEDQFGRFLCGEWRGEYFTTPETLPSELT